MKLKKINISKKALVTELRNIIIAVVCIVLLIYLAVKIYGILTVSSDLEKAKASLNAIAGKAEALGNDEQAEYLITGPQGWFIHIFTAGNPSPKDCNNLDCICFCSARPFNIVSTSLKTQEEIIEGCNAEATCKTSSVEIKFTEAFVLRPYFSTAIIPVSLGLKKDGEIVYLSGANSLEVTNILTDLVNSVDTKKLVYDLINDPKNATKEAEFKQIIVSKLGTSIKWIIDLKKGDVNEAPADILRIRSDNLDATTVTFMLLNPPKTAYFVGEDKAGYLLEMYN